MTSQEAADKVPYKPGRTRQQFAEAVRKLLVKSGERAIKANYDSAGNCFTCGEAGRCPGYHTESEERAAADRARARMAASVPPMELPAAPAKPLKGLRLSILHDKRIGNCSNGGISSRCSEVTLVGPGIAEIFEATSDAPAVKIVSRNIGGEYLHVEPIEPVNPETWAIWPAAPTSRAATAASRSSRATRCRCTIGRKRRPITTVSRSRRNNMAIKEGDFVVSRSGSSVEVEHLKPVLRVDGFVLDAMGKKWVALTDLRTGAGAGCLKLGQVKLAQFDLDGRRRLPCGHFTHENGGPADYPTKCRRFC